MEDGFSKTLIINLRHPVTMRFHDAVKYGEEAESHPSTKQHCSERICQCTGNSFFWKNPECVTTQEIIFDFLTISLVWHVRLINFIDLLILLAKVFFLLEKEKVKNKTNCGHKVNKRFLGFPVPWFWTSFLDLRHNGRCHS